MYSVRLEPLTGTARKVQVCTPNPKLAENIFWLLCYATKTNDLVIWAEHTANAPPTVLALAQGTVEGCQLRDTSEPLPPWIELE